LIAQVKDENNSADLQSNINTIKELIAQVKDENNSADLQSNINEIKELIAQVKDENNSADLQSNINEIKELIAQVQDGNNNFEQFEQVKLSIDKLAEHLDQSNLHELSNVKEQIQALHLSVLEDKDKLISTTTAQQSEILDAISAMRIQLGRIKVEGDGIAEYDNAVDSMLLEELVSLRSMLSKATADKSDKFSDLVSEQLEELKDTVKQLSQNGNINSALDLLTLQNDIAELKHLNNNSNSLLQQGQESILQILNIVTQKIDNSSLDNFEEIKAQISKMHDELTNSDAVNQQDQAAILQSLMSISQQLDNHETVVSDSNIGNESSFGVDELLLEELTALKNVVANLKSTGSDQPLSDEISETIKRELSVLNHDNQGHIDNLIRQEITALRQEISLLSNASNTSDAVNVDLLQQQLDSLKDDLLQGISKNIDVKGSDTNSESIADIKKSVVQLRDTVSKMITNSDYINDFAEQFELLQKELSEVRQAKEEPDYGVLNEVMAVRNEFQAVKTELGKLADSAIDKSQIQADDNQNVLAEVRDIKEQLFAASMANIGDDDTDEFENYNKIIISEIEQLRDQVDFIKDLQEKQQSETNIESLLQELNILKDSIENLKNNKSED
jgi:DNA repair exonuclease SbcCD ATPase subunit